MAIVADLSGNTPLDTSWAYVDFDAFEPGRDFGAATDDTDASVAFNRCVERAVEMVIGTYS